MSDDKYILIDDKGVQSAAPANFEYIGLIEVEGQKGLLVRSKKGNRAYGQYIPHEAKVKPLDQRKILPMLNSSNAKKMDGGVRKNVYMDDDSIQKALEIGSGNLSEGIRIALRTFK